MPRDRNPLEPAASSVYVIFIVTAVLTSITILGLVIGSGRLFGIGDPDACVEVRWWILPGPHPQTGTTEPGVLDGVTSSTSTVSMCATMPSTVQRILNVVTQLPTFLVFVGALLLAMRLFRSARRQGIFTDHTARMLRGLGWFVLAGELAATLLEALARLWLTNTMLSTPLSSSAWLGDWDMPVLALLLGAVLISMARIMGISTAMREDLEGTV